jgi:subtilisin family serine protease
MGESAARRLAADPEVSSVELDRTVTLADDPEEPTWGLDRVDQREPELSGTYARASAAGVTAYILDTGVRISHREFGGRARYGYDFVDNDSVANDCNGHGTHVAGTVGGATVGVASDIKIVGVRVLNCAGSASYSQIIAGVNWVTKHAVRPAVVNMSLGGSASAALDTAVRNSIASGITYVVAAGNSKADACATSPARVGAAITVGATDRSDARASFSNHGSCLDVFAPGVEILSAYRTGDRAAAWMSGTSMAAPHVCGAAALVLARRPDASPAQVRDALVAAATKDVVTDARRGSPTALLYTGAFTGPIPVTAPKATAITKPKTTTSTKRKTTTTKKKAATKKKASAKAIITIQ